MKPKIRYLNVPPRAEIKHYPMPTPLLLAILSLVNGVEHLAEDVRTEWARDVLLDSFGSTAERILRLGKMAEELKERL